MVLAELIGVINQAKGMTCQLSREGEVFGDVFDGVAPATRCVTVGMPRYHLPCWRLCCP